MSKIVKSIAVTMAVASVGAVGLAHTNKTQIENQVKNVNLLAVPENTIPLSQVVVRAQSWGTWYGEGLQYGGVVLGSDLKFNPNTMKVAVSNTTYSLGPGYENTPDLYTQYTLFNPNLVSEGTFNQQLNGNIAENTLNNATFNYGDILNIHSTHNVLLGTTSTAGALAVGSTNTGVNSYYQITKDGLVPMNGAAGTSVFVNGKPQQSGWVTVNGNKYYMQNGSYTTGNLTLGNIEYTFNNEGVLQSQKTLPTISLNSWKVDNVVQLVFNNGKVAASGQHKWLGTQISPTESGTVDFGFYSSTGDLIKQYNYVGTEFGSDVATAINGQSYTNGDIFVLDTNLPGINNTYGSGTTINTVGNKGESNVPLDTKIAYEITSTGLTPLNGYHELGGILYDFTNGIPKAATDTPELNGVGNITISYGSKFDPMEGVTLTDAADPTAKIVVSGSVNTEKPGAYTLTYTVTDSYGRTVTAKRIVTVSGQAALDSIYWNGANDNQSLVINGNVSSQSPISWKINKQLVIENAEGTVVKTLNTSTVNWYSSNKDDYSGFQAVIPGADLAGLQAGQTYQIAVKYDGITEPVTSMDNLPQNNSYYLGSNNQGLTISKVGIATGGKASFETAYGYNNGFIINANVDLDGQVASQNSVKTLLIKNSEGQVVYSTNPINVNWFSSNKDNYSGFQAYIPESELSKLTDTAGYSISVQTKVGGEIYETPIMGNSPVSVSQNGYTLFTKNGELQIGKDSSQSMTATSKIKYTDADNTVQNFELSIPNVPAGSQAEVTITKSNGKTTTITPSLVNWYSGSKDNYNGLQIIVPTNGLPYKSAVLTVKIGNVTYTDNVNL